MSRKIESRVEALVEPIVAGLGYELVGVEFAAKKSEPSELIIYIDKEGGVNLDDTEIVSRAIDSPIEQDDPIESSYVLCVSSPGLDRPLKREKDFLRAMGKAVDVRLYTKIEGSKEFVGVLCGYDGRTVAIETLDGRREFPVESVAIVRLHIDF